MASAFLARTNLRPRGYAGDSVLMRWIYQRGHVGETAFGCLMHRHPLETPAAQAVRNRRAFIADLARRMTSAAGGDVPLRIMSIACGPAWEVRDLFQRPEDGPRFAVTLLDQDSRALAEARTGVLQLQRGLGIPINARLVQGSVRQLIRSQHPAQTWGRHRLIYSMGLFDYLQHEFAARLASQLFDMLEPGGKLVVGNYHVGNPTRCYMEYWMDWPLVHRTEEEMRSLADGLPGAEASLSFEDTGCQMFLELTRPPDPA
jgi:extracellular factor (EF) 3-hydroxypalmitic acid methyl ester biosynthesis protein